jgi:hypothetical protein
MPSICGRTVQSEDWCIAFRVGRGIFVSGQRAHLGRLVRRRDCTQGVAGKLLDGCGKTSSHSSCLWSQRVSEDITGCHGPSTAQPDAPECGAEEKSGCSARDDGEEVEWGRRTDPPYADGAKRRPPGGQGRGITQEGWHKSQRYMGACRERADPPGSAEEERTHPMRTAHRVGHPGVRR